MKRGLKDWPFADCQIHREVKETSPMKRGLKEEIGGLKPLKGPS